MWESSRASRWGSLGSLGSLGRCCVPEARVSDCGGSQEQAGYKGGKEMFFHTHLVTHLNAL